MELSNFDLLNDTREFECKISGKVFDVLSFEGKEAVFSEFRFYITIVSEEDLDEKEFTGKECGFSILGNEKNNDFFGYVSGFFYKGKNGRFKLYEIILEPLLKKLSFISDVRIFQELKTIEIVSKVLEEGGIPKSLFESRLKNQYSPREYCVQFRETNLEFIKRIMAEDGIYFFFENKEGKTLLVLADSSMNYVPITGEKEIRFLESGQLTKYDEHVQSLRFGNNVKTGKMSLKDYNFINPSVKPESQLEDKDYSDLEQYDYPGLLVDEVTEKRMAEVNLQRVTLDLSEVTGAGNCNRFLSGHVFKLSDHLNKKINKEYLLLKIKHEGKQPQVLQEHADSSGVNFYLNKFNCVDSKTEFRPEKIEKPSARGIQTATVTGPSGEEIYVDEYGRIKVQFHWDREGKYDEKTSCWMRVAQPWAGAGWGTVFIPRIGQEVIISFIDGDPDRPVVTGALYNGSNMLPYSMPEEKTKSTIKTRSTKGGGGFNELRFEDKKGDEEIYIHGEKDWNIEILNDKTQHIYHDEKLNVDNDRKKVVGNDQGEEIGNNKDIKVKVNHTENIGENMSLVIGKNKDEKTGENKTIDIGKNYKETISEESSVVIGKNSTLSTGDDSKVSVGKNQTQTIGQDFTGDVGQNAKQSIGKDLSVTIGKKTIISSGDEITLVCGSASIVMKKDGKILINGSDIKINASGKLINKAQKISGN